MDSEVCEFVLVDTWDFGSHESKCTKVPLSRSLALYQLEVNALPGMKIQKSDRKMLNQNMSSLQAVQKYCPLLFFLVCNTAIFYCAIKQVKMR
jgi:hypothetical protein